MFLVAMNISISLEMHSIQKLNICLHGKMHSHYYDSHIKIFNEFLLFYTCQCLLHTSRPLF